MANIRNIDTAPLKCRDTTCFWDHIRSEDTKHPKYWGTYRYDLCIRCGTVKRRIENSDGTIAKSPVKYIYTPEYKKALQFTREEARKELNRRAKKGSLETTYVFKGGRGQANLRVVAS